MRRRLTVPVSLALIAALLLACMPLRSRLLLERRSRGLREVELSKLPPLGAASMLLLGGFRGVAVDVLWLKVMALHQQRQYEEERSLIELITRLQPYDAGVWVFQAHNIAYNISVQSPDLRDQYVWVKNGIQFLRRGLEPNPDNGDIYFFLGIICRSKISQHTEFEDWMEEDEDLTITVDGKVIRNNFEMAAYYYDRARKLGGVETFAPRMVDSGVFHSYLLRAEQMLRRAALTDDLTFSPETMARVQPFMDLCRKEAEHLLTTYVSYKDGVRRTDKAFELFPARVDLLLFDGYLKQTERALAEGDFSPAAVKRARKILDKALAQLEQYRPRYEKTESDQVVRNKTTEAYTLMPHAMALKAYTLVDRPFVSQEDRRWALRLLEQVKIDLDSVPAVVETYPDTQGLKAMAPAAIAQLKAEIARREKDQEPVQVPLLPR